MTKHHTQVTYTRMQIQTIRKTFTMLRSEEELNVMIGNLHKMQHKKVTKMEKANETMGEQYPKLHHLKAVEGLFPEDVWVTVYTRELQILQDAQSTEKSAVASLRIIHDKLDKLRDEVGKFHPDCVLSFLFRGARERI